MVRFISLFAMTGLFLLISPKLRLQVSTTLESGVNGMDANAPWSYIAAGVLILMLFLFSLYRGAQPS
jgi:hypothetical protein